MFTRRNLLRTGLGALAAPAIIRPASAWIHGAPSIKNLSSSWPLLGQIKPLGLPRVNWNHPLTTGLIFYGFDLGNGTYVNLCPGPALNYTSIQLANAANDFGAMTLFPGLTLQAMVIQPGPGIWIKMTPDIAVVAAMTLQNQAVAVGNTFACGCYRLAGTISADFEWIFGSTGVSAGEGAIPVSFAFVEALPPNGNYQIGCYILHNPSGNFGSESQFKVGGDHTITPGQFTSFMCSTVNTSASPGTGTSTFYAQGEAVGSPSTGVSMWNYNPFNVAETEVMFGGNIHTDTTAFHHAFGGFVPYGALWKRPLIGAEAKYLHLNPYCMLM